jgi:hypothetical protein
MPFTPAMSVARMRTNTEIASFLDQAIDPLRIRCKARNVTARAERTVASAGQHNTSYRRIGAALLGGKGELLCRQHVDRIQLRRTIDRDADDVFLDAVDECLVCHRTSLACHFPITEPNAFDEFDEEPLKVFRFMTRCC